MAHRVLPTGLRHTVAAMRTSQRNDHLAVAHDLQQRCGAVVQVPGDPGYETSRLAWNLAAEQFPAAVALPRTISDVQEIVAAADAAGLRVAAQSTGHGARALAARGLGDVVLLRTAALTGVQVDPVSRIARVGAGVTWTPVVEQAARHELIGLHGSAPDVGVVGYSLSGGIGWYARKFGFARDRVTSIELVTAGADVIQVDADRDAPLFDAMRAGGAGSFGVVTGLEFELLPMRIMYGGMLVWPFEHADRVLRAWLDWSASAPDEVSTMFRLLNLPDVPAIPEQLRGRSIMIDGAVTPGGPDPDSVLAPLRRLAPSLDTFVWRPPAELAGIHLDPEHPIPSQSAALTVRDVPDDAITVLLDSFDPRTPLAFAGFRQLGGALTRGGLSGSFLFQAGGAATDERAEEAVRSSVAPTLAALRTHQSDRPLLGFADDPIDVRAGFDAETWRRMATVRAHVDPHGLFVANHPIG